MQKIKNGLLLCCFLAGIGYFLPAVNVNINVPDVYKLSMKFNLGSLFSLIQSGDSAGLGGNVSGESMKKTLDEILELLSELHLESLVSGLTISMVFYIFVILILVVLLILILIDKFNRAIITMAAISVVFYIYIVFQLIRLPGTLTTALNKNLGFFAGFIDLSKAVNINLGIGFWLTFIAIICMLAICLYTLLKNKKSSENANIA